LTDRLPSVRSKPSDEDLLLLSLEVFIERFNSLNPIKVGDHLLLNFLGNFLLDRDENLLRNLFFNLLFLRFFFEEGDCVVVSVEVGRIAAHKDVTDNHVVEAFRYFLAHDAHEALGLAKLSHLDDVV